MSAAPFGRGLSNAVFRGAGRGHSSLCAQHRSTGAEAQAHGFAEQCRVSAELPRTMSPSRDPQGSKVVLAPHASAGSMPGPAAQASAASWHDVLVSCRSGVVSESWGGVLGVVGSHGLFSSVGLWEEREQQSQLRSSAAVRPYSTCITHIPTWGTRTPNPLDFHMAKNSFLKASQIEDFFISSPNSIKLFPFLPPNTCSTPEHPA